MKPRPQLAGEVFSCRHLVDPTHGNQDKNYFNGSCDGHCFLPLYVFRGDQMLVAYLRPGSVGAAHHARAVTKRLVQ